jgi:hypothetical protein
MAGRSVKSCIVLRVIVLLGVVALGGVVRRGIPSGGEFLDNLLCGSMLIVDTAAAGVGEVADSPAISPAAPGNGESAVPEPVFPTVQGENLEKRLFRLPADFEGEMNVVLIAFQREQQAQVDTWVPFLRQFAAEQPRLRYYELPTIKKMGGIMRWIITGGMARGIDDPKARAATITLFLDKEPFCRALGIRTEDVITVAVVDRSGRVHWQTVGTCTPEKEEAVRMVLARD